MSLAEDIPNEMLEIVFDYLENTSLSKKFLCKKRECKLNNTLRKYMKTFMPTTVYCTYSIKYYRQLYDKNKRPDSFIIRYDLPSWRRRSLRQKVFAQQCCAKTNSGRRCKKKTFMLFCECHKNAKPYWM
jgi:hypothetical protein